MRTALIWLAVAFVVIGGGVMVLLPNMCRPRESANRVKCATTLSAIGRAISMYADEHAHAAPDSFKTLLRTEDLVPDVFTCPSGTAERATSVEAFADTPADCGYVYCGDGLSLTDLPGDVVLALDRVDNHDHDGINVLFGDLRVEFEPIGRDEARATPEWTNVQSQLAAHVRPVRWRRLNPTTSR